MLQMTASCYPPHTHAWLPSFFIRTSKTCQCNCFKLKPAFRMAFFLVSNCLILPLTFYHFFACYMRKFSIVNYIMVTKQLYTVHTNITTVILTLMDNCTPINLLPNVFDLNHQVHLQYHYYQTIKISPHLNST